MGVSGGGGVDMHGEGTDEEDADREPVDEESMGVGSKGSRYCSGCRRSCQTLGNSAGRDAVVEV